MILIDPQSFSEFLKLIPRFTRHIFSISQFNTHTFLPLQKLCFWCSNPFICIQDHPQKFWNHLLKISGSYIKNYKKSVTCLQQMSVTSLLCYICTLCIYK